MRRKLRAAVFGAGILLSSHALYGSDKTATFRGSPDQVFDAAQLSAQKYWALSFSDRSTRLLSFVTGRSFASHGMECGVSLKQREAGEVEVVLHTQKKDGQIYAFGAGDRIAKKFFEELRSELAQRQAQAGANAPDSLSTGEGVSSQ